VERQQNGESPRRCRVRGGPKDRSASRPLMLLCVCTDGRESAYADDGRVERPQPLRPNG